MKNLLIGAVLTLVLLSTIPACDPCNDCGPTTFEPEVSATFFNGDSLTTMRDSLVVVDTLIAVTDSLIIILDSIQNGGDLESEQQSLEMFIDGLTDARLGRTEAELASYLVNQKSEVEVQITLLETGNTKLDALDLITTGLGFTDLDSSDVFLLPMVLDSDGAVYTMEIDGEEYAMGFTYELVDEFDADKNLLRDALLSEVTISGFDSLFCICDLDTVQNNQVNCLASQTTIHAYF